MTDSYGMVREGVLGTMDTLDHMRMLVQQSLDNAKFKTWVADQIADADMSNFGIIQRIRFFMHLHFCYESDPLTLAGHPVEDLLIAPWRQMDRWYAQGTVGGDCDDAAMLVAALGKRFAVPAQFRAVGIHGWFGPFTHVYTLLRAPDQWITVDPTIPPTASHPVPDRVMEVPV